MNKTTKGMTEAIVRRDWRTGDPIYHILWKDYDGTYHVRFTYEGDARKETAAIALKEHNKVYGTELLNVFYGIDVEVNIAQPTELSLHFEAHRS